LQEIVTLFVSEDSQQFSERLRRIIFESTRELVIQLLPCIEGGLLPLARLVKAWLILVSNIFTSVLIEAEIPVLRRIQCHNVGKFDSELDREQLCHGSTTRDA
jgi:hypothetical protein